MKIARSCGWAMTPHARLSAQVEAIFFEASGRTFAPGPERDAFHERWLGRYLQGDTDVVLLALDGRETVAGYLVGALDDPSAAAALRRYLLFQARVSRSVPALSGPPAHQYRARLSQPGMWALQLIEAFAARARQAGAPGMHVVTGKAGAQRNVLRALRILRARRRPSGTAATSSSSAEASVPRLSRHQPVARPGTTVERARCQPR